MTEKIRKLRNDFLKIQGLIFLVILLLQRPETVQNKPTRTKYRYTKLAKLKINFLIFENLFITKNVFKGFLLYERIFCLFVLFICVSGTGQLIIVPQL